MDLDIRKKCFLLILSNYRVSWKWLYEYIVFDIVGEYGTAPKKVFKTMLIVVAIFACMYYLAPFITFSTGSKIQIIREGMNTIGSVSMNGNPVNITSIIDSFYYSGITFLTVGYGDIYPISFFAKILSVGEGFLGIFLMAYFTVSFVRKLLR